MREMLNGWEPYYPQPARGASADDERTFMPAFDVRETGDAYLFKADVPGFREKDVEIQLQGSRLVITGRREAESIDDSDTHYCRERWSGSFTRAFTLPEGIAADRIHAELRDGVLSIQVPKAAQQAPQRIAIGARPPGKGQA